MKSLYTLFTALALAASCSKTPSTPADASNDLGGDAQQQPDGDAPDLDRSDAPGWQSGCNPLAQEYDCLLPFPSDAFRGPAGVAIPDVATPHDKTGAPVLAFEARTADGFSVSPSILFTFGDGLDPESLVSQSDAASSILASSPTLLLDTETGAAVPHFSEVYLGGGPELQIGAIRPLVRLTEGRRYVVAVQNLRHVDGTDVTPPAAFQALRNATPYAEIEDLRTRFDAEIFDLLETFGVARADLDLAWDFTTRTRDDLMGDMLSVRNGTLTWLETNTPTVTITRTVEGTDLGVNLQENTARHVEGTFTAPLWTETNAAGAVLRGPQGAREIVGTIEVPFTVTIPKSIGESPMQRGSFIQYGHGFFGSRDEVISLVQSKFGNDFGYVMGAVEWSGMTRADRDWVVTGIAEGPEAAFGFVQRVHQGMANQLVFTEVVRGVLAAEPAMEVGGSRRLAYRPDEVYFLGISQGHILGGTLFALSPSIERAVLNVGGASFGLILTRSYAFLLYERLLAQWFEPLELLKFEAVAPQVLDVIDPIAYAPLVLSEPLPGAVPKQILLQAGMGDAAVPNVATELHARALGIDLITPTNASVSFLNESAAPAASGITFLDFGIDPLTARPWKPVTADTTAHDNVRSHEGVRQQMSLFLRPGGQIEDTCSGPCVAP